MLEFGIGLILTSEWVFLKLRTINPFAKTDWEGTGVEPDVMVNVADALVTAEKLAEKALQKK